MPPPARARRADALSKDVVVAAALALLDEHGERGFTLKLLTERLRTGAGAVYWHVAGRDELVALASDRVMDDALDAATRDGGDDDASRLRVLALAVYDALAAHPWAADTPAFLSERPSALRLLDRVGQLVTRPTQPAAERFLLATVVATYVLGVAVQDARRGPPAGDGRTREAALGDEGARWASLDPRELPFVTSVAGELAGHDDREQFLAGLDLILAGLRSRAS